MSNEEAIANLVGLMTSLHLEIKALPDDLKCAKCKSVLKNACQMPCGCRFCRACIDDVISSGDQFCPGTSQECGATPLSTAVPDNRANKSVLKLTAKCPHEGCSRECSLADMEGHMHACSSKNIDCPLRELGSAPDALPGDKVSGQLLQESGGHSEILIGTVANINKDMEMLKRELLLKDEQGRYMENEMKSMKDENKSIKIENEAIKREKEVLCDQVRQLMEKLEREIDERRQNDERDSAMVTAVTAAVASNRDEMKPVRDDIRSIREQFDRMKLQMETIRMAVGLGQLNDWLIKEDMTKTGWGCYCSDDAKASGKFGLTHTFDLASANYVTRGELWIWLRIWAGLSDSLLWWPFKGAVTVTMAPRDKGETCKKRTLQCEIERPVDNQCSNGVPFVFCHVALKEAGVNPKRGVRISCRIVPGTGQ